MSPWVGKSMDRKRNARRNTRRDSIPETERCKTCDGTGHGLGGFYCVPCMGSGRATPADPAVKETER